MSDPAPPPVILSSPGAPSFWSEDPTEMPPNRTPVPFVMVGHLHPGNSPKNEAVIKMLRRIAAQAFVLTQDKAWFLDTIRQEALGRVRPLLSPGSEAGQLLLNAEALQRTLGEWMGEDQNLDEMWVITLPIHYANRPESLIRSFIAWLGTLPHTAQGAKSCQPFDMPTRELVSFDTDAGGKPFSLPPDLGLPDGYPKPTHEVTSFIHAFKLFSFTHGMPMENVHFWAHPRAHPTA